MTENEAKEIIKNDPDGNILKRLEAINLIVEILGDNCSMENFWKLIDNNQ